MCAINIWAVNAAALTPRFEAFTERSLGVAPQPSTARIVSDLVRPSAAVFTLERRMCDCYSLLGRGSAAEHEGEVSAEQWLSWIRGMPAQVPHLGALAVLRAWAPQSDRARPSTERCVSSGEVDEALLRGVEIGALLVIELAASS